MDDLLTMIGMEPPSTAADGEGALSVTAPEQPAPASPIPPTELTLMPAASSSAPMAQASGEHFMMWLKQGITSHKLIINDAKALVHTVSDTAYLVSPGVFQRYAQEHPQVAALAKQEEQQDWQWVQKRFEKLQQHRKQRSEEHTSELQSLMRISYAVFCLKKKNNKNNKKNRRRKQHKHTTHNIKQTNNTR